MSLKSRIPGIFTFIFLAIILGLSFYGLHGRVEKEETKIAKQQQPPTQKKQKPRVEVMKVGSSIFLHQLDNNIPCRETKNQYESENPRSKVTFIGESFRNEGLPGYFIHVSMEKSKKP